jgi:hypothetical protein
MKTEPIEPIEVIEIKAIEQTEKVSHGKKDGSYER